MYVCIDMYVGMYVCLSIYLPIYVYIYLPITHADRSKPKKRSAPAAVLTERAAPAADDHGESDGDDGEGEEADGSNDDDLGDDFQSTTWPAKPVDYDSGEDYENLRLQLNDVPVLDSVEKFAKGEYVCLMVKGDLQAYAQLKVQSLVDLEVYALQKSPCGLKRYGPGVYALVEFCHFLPGVCTIQVL